MPCDNRDPSASPKRVNKDHFFPTQIYFTDLVGFEALNADLRDKVYAWRDADPHGTLRSNVAQAGAWHSATDMHSRREYNALTIEIFDFIQAVFDDLGYDPEYEPVCDSMWVNISARHGYNRHHTHPHALWSGVYYVQTPPNCGLLYFTDPRPQAQVLTPYYDPKRRKSSTWNEVFYQPQEGRLVVFPGWLVHAVQPNLAEAPDRAGDRISVSFNFYQRRRGVGNSNPHRNEIVREDLV